MQVQAWSSHLFLKMFVVAAWKTSFMMQRTLSSSTVFLVRTSLLETTTFPMLTLESSSLNRFNDSSVH